MNNIYFPKQILLCVMGTVFEWYDFILFGSLSAILVNIFFPHTHPLNGKIFIFSIFAVGFIMRPLGAVFFGRLGDRYGRKKALLFSFLLMISATFLIGTLPAHGQWLSIILLVSLRLLQGFSTGGEFAGAMTLLAESAPKNNYCFVASFSLQASVIGVLLGTLMCAQLTLFLGHTIMQAWGWRIPFLLCLPLGLATWYARQTLQESSAFLTTRTQHLPSISLIKMVKQYRWPLIMAISIATISNIGFYLNFVYMNSFSHSLHKFGATTAMYVAIATTLAYGFSLPFFAYWADRVGKKRTMLTGCILLLIVSVPTLYYVYHDNGLASIMMQTLFAVILGIYGSCVPAFLAQLFPVTVRCTGVGIGMNFAASFFGGTAPVISALLVKLTGNLYMPAFYFGVIIIGVVAILWRYQEVL